MTFSHSVVFVDSLSQRSGSVSLFALVTALSLSGSSLAANAEDIESIIVTGTREKARTTFTSLAPVDVVTSKDLRDGASGSLNFELAQVIPSFDVQKLPTSDGLQFIRPAHLRGLSSDETLVLINGKRFHRTAFLGQRGAQGPDLAQIPNFAIDRVDVLRDGASAQYGSDAIAGVINIQLDQRPGYSAYAQGAQYDKGDGSSYQIGARAGFELGTSGFVAITAEASDADATSRSHQRPDAIAFATANPTLTVPNPVQRWGDPELTTRHFSLNGALPARLGEVYAFATYSSGEGVNDINWRIADASANAAVYKLVPAIFPGWNLKSIYPAGFTPREGIKYEDYQTALGWRGQAGTSFDWDLSVAAGENSGRFYLNNSINASLGPASPTSFYLGTQTQREFNVSGDGVYRLNLGLFEPMNIAFGAEHRQETYIVKAGDKASYDVGPGAAAGLAAGSNGFPGFSPQQAGSWDQDNTALYLDGEARVTEKWTAGAAVRYEDYSGFGSTTIGKVATRYEFIPDLALRASFNSGFRAPTPGQINSLSTSQGLDTVTLQVFTNGRLSPSNPIATFLGAKPLQPETSNNFSGGLVWRWGAQLSGSVDGYQVDVSKRFSSSPTHTLTAAEKNQLVAQGVSGASGFTSVYWFTNDFDTRTRGVDVVGEYAQDLLGGNLGIKVAFNHNQTSVTGGSLAANPTQKRLFEEGIPADNATLTATYSRGAFDYQLRSRYYGGWTDSSGNSTGDIFQAFGGIGFLDASVTWHFMKGLSAKLGAENILNTYPEKAIFQASRGIDYSRNAPYDTNGAQYYIRMSAKF